MWIVYFSCADRTDTERVVESSNLASLAEHLAPTPNRYQTLAGLWVLPFQTDKHMQALQPAVAESPQKQRALSSSRSVRTSGSLMIRCCTHCYKNSLSCTIPNLLRNTLAWCSNSTWGLSPPHMRSSQVLLADCSHGFAVCTGSAQRLHLLS